MNMKKLAMVMAVSVMGSAMAASPKVDVEKSQVKWEGKKVVGGHWGYVKIKSADIVTDAKGEPTSGKVVVDLTKMEAKDDDVDAESAPKLIGHLQSADFFDTAKYPEATFVAKKFTKVKGNEYKVDGDLTIKGKTNAESIKMDIEKEKSLTKIEGGLKFDRTKYGVMYNSGKLVGTLKDKAIRDEVALDIKLVLN